VTVAVAGGVEVTVPVAVAGGMGVALASGVEVTVPVAVLVGVRVFEPPLPPPPPQAAMTNAAHASASADVGARQGRRC
jgi:hypothetical protein